MIYTNIHNLEELLNITNTIQSGDMAVLENGKIYIFNEHEWVSIEDYKKENPKVELNVSLYDLNRNSVSLMPDITDFTQQEKDLKAFLDETKSQYYMLLSNDLRYYTVFAIEKKADCVFEEEVIGCLRDLGSVKLIDANYEDRVECWITTEDGFSHMLMLFPYERGVIHCL